MDATQASSRSSSGPRAEQREAALLDAAVELLREVGYERLTMDAVAARARASKATIYRRYTGKAELVVEALRRHEPRALREPIETDDLREDLREIVRRVVVFFSGRDGALLVGLLFAARTDPQLMQVVRDRLWADQRAAALAVLERARASGELPPHENGWVIDDVVGAVVFTRVVLGDPVDDAFIDHIVTDVLLPLLRAPA
jgi:AcrR family transcriptional regulator